MTRTSEPIMATVQACVRWNEEAEDEQSTRMIAPGRKRFLAARLKRNPAREEEAGAPQAVHGSWPQSLPVGSGGEVLIRNFATTLPGLRMLAGRSACLKGLQSDRRRHGSVIEQQFIALDSVPTPVSAAIRARNLRHES